MKKNLYSIILLSVAGMALLCACNTKKNTATNRRYHAFTARYNTYFNGKTSFDEALASMQNGHKENYTEQVYMFPVSALPKDKRETGGPFDRAIEKGNKAIKQHSIQQKPPRKPGWRNDPKQVAWQDKNEYNPFLKHCWLLIGQGQFYNADFLQASATFSYITRHYADDKEMVAEARIWQARCYTEINWLHEGGSILDNLKENGFPQANQNQFDRVYADYLIKSNQLEQAPPYLQKAIKSEKNRRQRTRMRYLLGQIYAETGQNEAAYQTFKKVAGSNPPYELEFAARIRQTEVFPGGRYQDVLKMLNRMAKSEKNKDYLDQVYYAIGNIYLERQDTVKAIENYALGIEKSTQNGLDKAICQIKLGDIYFTQKDYIKAQPCFSGAMAGIYREYKDYDRVSHLSAVLDELVVHVEAIHLQDSLQTLTKLPEDELLALIDKKIEEVKKQEEKEAAELEKERFLAEQESMGSPSLQQRRMGNEPSTIMPGSPGSGSFYFYNEQTVAQGKTQFQNKWGKRPLEDNWRLRKKSTNLMQPVNESGLIDDEFAMEFDEEGNPIVTLDSMQLEMDSLASDPKSRQYYLQQIPFSEEDMEASNLIIADGLYNSGMIYKDKLENKPLAVEAFEELERRFPENEYRLDYYFQSFLMGLRYNDNALSQKYKQKLSTTFPESDYAIAASDPNYEYNVRMMDSVQDSLYENTYNQYLNSDVSNVRQNYKKFSDTYPLSKLMPKFMFVEALTYVQEGDAEGFKAALDSLVKRFPREDVSELANEMLKGLLRGRTLVKGGFGSMKWNIRFGLDGDDIFSPGDSTLKFVDEPNTPHQMKLIYETGSIDRNQLLYTIAAYNFAKFEVKTFDLQMDEMGSLSLFTISGFNNLDEVLDYARMIFEPDGYANAISEAVSFFPFSERNFGTLMRGKTLEEYISFFAEHYAEKAPALIQRWKINIADDEKLAEAEDAAVEKAANIGAEAETTTTTPYKKTEEVIEETIAPKEEMPVEEKEVTKTEEEVIVPAISDIEKEEKAIEEEIPEKEADIHKTEEEKETEEELLIRDEEIQLTDSLFISDDEVAPTDSSQIESPKITKPKEITLDDLLERSKQRELEEAERKAEEERLKKEQRKEAEQLKKEKAKEREQLRKQKEKEAKDRLKQKEKERKEKERANRLRQKEKEAQRKAIQKEKEAQRKAAQKSKTSNKVTR